MVPMRRQVEPLLRHEVIAWLRSRIPSLILVSPWFAAVPFLRRPVEVLEAPDDPGGLELLCYTPEEFEEKREEFGIVRVALEEGISL